MQLIFNPKVCFGFEGKFNTFRLGKKVSDLEIGQTIQLTTKAGIDLGSARLLSVHVGDKNEMALAHAENNHFIRHKGLQGEIAATTLLKNLRNLYGKMIFERYEIATVIYLEMIE